MRQYIVDAFTDRLFHGNQAAVCVVDEWPSSQMMQSIAKENRFSETAFVVREPQGWHLRWFTPGGEIDFCGHATLGTAFVLLSFYCRDAAEISFDTQVGKVSVRRRGDLFVMDFPAYECRPVAVTDSMAAAEILSYIRNHCGEKLDRERLGAVFHYHPAHLNRLVRRYTGMTTHRYILYVRVRRAEYLLSTTDMPVTEIAHQLMFYDSSHFAAVFQRETGMPPGEYRRMARFV